MPFESVPDDIESFFNTGELPASLQGEASSATTQQTASEQLAPSESSVVADPQTGAEAATGTTPPAETTPPAAPVQPQVDYAAQVAQQQKTLDALTKTLADMQAAKQREIDEANKPVIPDKATDPLGYLDHRIKEVANAIEAMGKAQQKTVQETEQQTQFRQFVDTVNSKVAEFKQGTTDYDDAYKHLVSLRINDYTKMGYTADAARQLVGQEEARLAATALEEGKNPAQVAYDLAKSHGYVPKVKSAPIVPPESKLDSIKKGLETTGAERGAPPPRYSTDAIKDMSNAQLTDAVENHWEEMFGKSKGKGIFD